MRFLSRRQKGVAVVGRSNRQAVTELLRRAGHVEALEDRRYFAAQVSLDMTGVPTPTVLAGGNIQYTITVVNKGTDFASNVVITDQFFSTPTAGQVDYAPPASLPFPRFAAVEQIGGPTFTITRAPGVATFTIGQLNTQVPATFVITLQASINAPDNTLITNTATVSRSESAGDVDPTFDNTATVLTTVDRQSDVAIAKVLLPIQNAPATVDPNSVVAGLDATYEITVTNNGPNAADNVLLSDITPALTTYVSFFQTAGPAFIIAPDITRPLPPVGQAGTVQASIVSLPVGSSAVFQLTLHVASSAPDDKQVNQTATVSTTTFDANITNNQITQTAEIQIMTDIQVVSSPDKTIKTIEGTFFPYTFSIYNKGPSDAQGVAFTWTTPNTPPVADPGDLRPDDRLVYDRYGPYGSSFEYVTGPAFTVTVPPRPPARPRGTYNGSITTLPAGVGSTYQFFVGTPQQQDFVQNSTGSTASPDVDTTNNAYTDRFHVYDAPLIVQTVPNIQSNATQPLDVQVMTFTDTNAWPGNNFTLPYPNPGGRYDESFDFLATVNWGDNTASAAVISTDGLGTYHVTAQHTYANPGAYAVRVLGTGDGESVALGDSVALVGNAPRGGSQVGGLKFTENLTETKKIGAFAAGNAAAGTTFAALITWGDGTAATTGTLTAVGNGVYNITGTHKYLDQGTYTGNIRITGSDGIVNNLPMVVVVDDLSVIAVPVNVSAQQNIPITNVAVATFTDPGGADAVSTYQAQINWGDGTGLSNGIISYNAGTGIFTVRGSHTFTNTGNFTMTVTIAHGTAPNTVVNPVATVSVGPPVPPVSATASNFTAPLNVASSPTVATFTDPAGADVIANYTATIDWGDGTPATPGVITAGTGGSFLVGGTHTYTALGTYNLTVTITHLTSAATIVNPVGTVINPADPVTATPVNVTATTGVPATNVLVATFKDPNGAGALANYAAVIDWGDGTPTSAGTITYNATTQTFSVVGTHTFAAAGTYNMIVKISRVGSLDATVNPVATVADPSSITSVTGATINGVEGTQLTNVTVGSFVTSNLLATTTSFTAVINWGDGTATSVGTLVKTGNGMFAVRGTHLYKNDGKYNIVVTVTPTGQTARTINSIANIADAPLSGVKVTFSATKNVQFTNKLVGSFSDGNVYDLTPGEYAVTIAWGDSTATSTGTVTYNTTTKRWDIKGTHKYAKASPTGGFVLTITVKDGTQQIKINSVAIVT